jgi:autotransporter-associated beta strand protein
MRCQVAVRKNAPYLAAAVALALPALLPAQVVNEPVSVGDVTLLPSPFLDREEKHRTSTVANLSTDALLFYFRDIAGLPQPPGVTGSLGGWDAGFLRGHYAGHYLSAASHYAASGDAAYLGKVNYLVDELGKCQGASGYLSAFPEAVFDAFEPDPFNAHLGYSVPYYTIDKVISGLNDAYVYTGNTKALTIAEGMADYFAGRFAKLTPTQIQNNVGTNRQGGSPNEFGAIGQAFTDIYVHAKARGDASPERFLALANIFNNPTFLQPLAAGQDQLYSIHANTHIAQIVGVAKYANVTGDATTTAASANFWDIVLRQHTFANGGNSFAETFRAAGVEAAGTGSLALTNNTAETCNTYNMVRLSELLFARNHDPKYAAYIESALYNQILTSHNPATGMMTYYTLLAPGSTRSYGTILGTTWCCEGTGIESPAAYADKIYFKTADTLYTNVYIPSQVHWAEKNLTITQQNQLLTSDTISFTTAAPATTHAKLDFRVPGWTFGNVTVSVNGVAQGIAATRGTYLSLDRDWANGDVVSITMPKKLYLRRSMDDPDTVSIFYGPILLAGVWGPTLASPPTLNALNADPASFLALSDPATMTFTLHDLSTNVDMTFRPFYTVQGTSTKYSIYTKLAAPAATRTWRGGGMLSAFNDGTNWDLAPGNNDSLVFDGSLSTTPDNNFKADTPFAGITFSPSAAPFTIIGNRMLLSGNVTNQSANVQTIAAPLTLAAGMRTFSSPGGAPLVVPGNLSGPGGLNKTGAYTLTLAGNNSYTGGTTVSDGTLKIGNGGAAGSPGSGQVQLSNNAQLLIDRAGTLALTAPVSGQGRLVKTGPGVLSLEAPASYTGSTTIAQGTLQLNATNLASAIAHRWSFNNSLADSAGVSPATIIDVGSLNTSLSATGITLAGGGRTAADFVRLGADLLPNSNTPVTIELWATPVAVQNWSRILDMGSSSTENLFMSWTRGTTLANDRVEWRDSVTTTADDTSQPYVLGTRYHLVLVIEPSGAGSAVRWYSAPAANAALGDARGTFTTANTIAAFNDAEVNLGRSFYSADATASATYDEVRFWNGALSQSTLELLHAAGPDAVLASFNSTGRLPATTDLELTGTGATFDLNGVAQAVATLSGIAGTRVGNSSAATTLTLAGAGSTTFAGTLDGPLTLAKSGPGTLTLAGANAYAGATVISGGKVVLATAAAMPAGTNVTVTNASLDLGPGLFQPGSLALANAKAALAGASATVLQLNAAPTLSPTATLDVGNNALVITPAAAGKSAAVAALRTVISTARDADGPNTWTGPGITSSTAALDPAHLGVALADNADLQFTSFRGLPVDQNALLVTVAVLGDATLDNKVDAADLNVLATHWQKQSDGLWTVGDFTGDGKVDAFDLNALASNWQAGASLQSALGALPWTLNPAPGPSAIPEPASLPPLCLAAALLLRRRGGPRRSARA